MTERRRGSLPQTIGGVLVGFDEQVWSRRPPAQEQVAAIDRVSTVVTPEGLSIELPPGDTTGDPADAVGDRRPGA